MQQNTKRLLSMLIALVVLVAAVIFFFDVVEPVYGSVQTLKGQLLAETNFSKSESQDIAQANQLIDQYNKYASGTSSLDLAMPSGEDLAGAIAQIYGAAQQNSLAVQSIGITVPAVAAAAPLSAGTSAGTAQLVKPLGTIILQVSGTGTYENFKLFLVQLENNIRLFDVKSISLTPAVQSAGKNAQDFFTYNIAATTYYQSQ